MAASISQSERPQPFGAAEVGVAEVGVGEVGAVEFGVAEVGPHLGILTPPSIPRGDPTLKKLDMFLVRHRASPVSTHNSNTPASLPSGSRLRLIKPPGDSFADRQRCHGPALVSPQRFTNRQGIDSA